MKIGSRAGRWGWSRSASACRPMFRCPAIIRRANCGWHVYCLRRSCGCGGSARSSRRQEKVLTHLALSDPLTGLPNRRAWEQQLADRLGAATEGSLWCLAMLDVDLFHEINDRLGHVEGDACLRRIADRLASSVRRAGFLARLGGDEFAVLLEGVDGERASAVIDLIRIQAGEDGDAALAHPPLKLSAGWAVFTGPASRTATQEAHRASRRRPPRSQASRPQPHAAGEQLGQWGRFVTCPLLLGQVTNLPHFS